MKVEQIDNQLPSLKIDLQLKNFKIEPIEQILLLESRIEIIDHIYNQRFKNIWIIVEFNNLQFEMLDQGDSRNQRIN